MPYPPYVLATPVRNEVALVSDLVATMDALTPRPTVWVIVDDGSTDGSAERLEAAAAARPWMIVRPAPEKATEYLGGHVARIKRWGLAEAIRLAAERDTPAVFAGIIDADIVAPPDHYARLMDALLADRRLGVVSSVIASQGEGGGDARADRFQRTDEPRGGTQFFTVECLDAIGGLPPWPGFDGAANIMARARGYRTALVADLVAVQRREMAARFGVAAGYERRGRYAWFLGLHPLLVVGRAGAYGVTVAPSAGTAFLRGYVGDALKRRPRCPDPDVRRHYGWRRIAEVAGGVLGRARSYVK